MPDPIIFEAGQTGLDCYVRFDDAGDTAVDLTAGSGLKATRYTASAGDLVGAALPAGTYYPNIFAGTASSQSTSDQWLAEVDAFHWSGTLEIPSWAKLIAAREGYNNVLEVGAGQPYATIISATNAAVAGDLVVVHPGTYNQSELGKNGVTLWFAPGAVVEIDAQDDSPMFDSSVTNLRVLGFGKFHTGIDGRLYNGTIANCDAIIECDWLSLDSTDDEQVTSTQATGRVRVRARRIDASNPLAIASAGQIEVEAGLVEASGLLASTSSSGVVALNLRYAVCLAASPFGGTGGTISFRGHLRGAHSSATGLNAPAGVTLVADRGAIQVDDGRPSLSGSGTHLLSAAVARRG